MRHALFSFFGASALFLSEPFLGKALTPRYGGGAQVWLVCLLFFQAAVLVGYAYGHFLGRLRHRVQVWLHFSLLATCLAWAWRSTGIQWLPPLDQSNGIGTPSDLFVELIRGPGALLCLLSATSPLAHRWYVAAYAAEPYRLYAWSNAGSLLGLIAFPLALEPWLSQAAQGSIIWGLVLGLALLTVGLTRGGTPALELAESFKIRPAWILSSAVGSGALVASTSHLSHEVGAIPLLWIVPLAAYLLSFILVFDARWPLGSEVMRPIWYASAAVGAILLAGLKGAGIAHPMRVAMGAFLFVGGLGLAFHGRLHQDRPGGPQATIFLLSAAFGGVLGGVTAAVGAPLLLNHLLEVGLLASGAGVIGLSELLRSERPRLLAGMAALALAASGAWNIGGELRKSGVFTRNFYGIVRLEKSGSLLAMKNLQTLHGAVDLKEPTRPLTYYTPASGLGRAFEVLRNRKDRLRVGVLGLGVGSTAAYARPGDHFEFLELNPSVAALAGDSPNALFPYLRQARGEVVLRVGDGRGILARDRLNNRPGGFDLLLIDAFSGDSIPWHLMTMEALELYLWHLAPEGILVVHVTNPLPVDRLVIRAASRRGLFAALIADPGEGGIRAVLHTGSVYVLLARRGGVLEDARIYSNLIAGVAPGGILAAEPRRKALATELAKEPWTDGKSSLSTLLLGGPLIGVPANESSGLPH